MGYIKIRYDNGDKGWALLDEREFVEGVHERWMEPTCEAEPPKTEKPVKGTKAAKSDKLIDILDGVIEEKPGKTRKG